LFIVSFVNCSFVEFIMFRCCVVNFIDFFIMELSFVIARCPFEDSLGRVNYKKHVLGNFDGLMKSSRR